MKTKRSEARLGSPLGDAEREALHRAVRDDGEYDVIKEFAIGRPTLARALAGLGLRRGTIAQISDRLRDRAAARDDGDAA